MTEGFNDLPAKAPATPGRTAAMPEAFVVRCRNAEIDSLLASEWLLANRIGAYASSTVIGCNTRRYHGLLVAATSPPMGRITALSTVMEELTVGRLRYELATNEFPGVFSPRGVTYLTEFRNGVAATFIYHAGGLELIKEIVLAESANATAIRYTVRGGAATLRVRPFAALRDFHHLRLPGRHPRVTFQPAVNGVTVGEPGPAAHQLYLLSGQAKFIPRPDWWHNFLYRMDLERGQDATEDLYTPGTFEYELADGQSCQFAASLDEPRPPDFDSTRRRRHARLAELSASAGPAADQCTRRLAMAAETFVARRNFPSTGPSATILAGFHWFADWGRDAMLSLPGLLLTTGRFGAARAVFRTFASRLAGGLVPNRFDDYAGPPHYNSIDASLWFIIAAERYVRATADTDFWAELLMPAAHQILTAYQAGTKFDIHADADGLLAGGSEQTQLTWMDAAPDGHAVTPRHGKAVEINALWHSAHRIMAHRCAEVDPPLAGRYADRAALMASAFTKSFWNEQAGCLFDCINGGCRDESMRPNQIFAVSLPHSPLPRDKQGAVVRAVAQKLLTPYGLRTLSPDDRRYQKRCTGPPDQRDRAYHQGTVWPFLLGPFVEAYLKVNRHSPLAVAQARHWLLAIDDHLAAAGLGFISEIFDGDAPHCPRGCIAQAWSVAEILRAKKLIEQHSGPGHLSCSEAEAPKG